MADLSAFNEGGGGGSPGLCGLRRSAGGSLLLTQFPRSLTSRVQFPRPLSDESVCFSFYSRSCGFTYKSVALHSSGTPVDEMLDHPRVHNGEQEGFNELINSSNFCLLVQIFPGWGNLKSFFHGSEAQNCVAFIFQAELESEFVRQHVSNLTQLQSG